MVCELSLGVGATPDGSSSCGQTIARFSVTAGTGAQTVRYDASTEQYIVNWNTDQCTNQSGVTVTCTLNTASYYRVVVAVAGTRLGHVDIDPVRSATDLRNWTTGGVIALVNGRTLPIKFRIERGAVFAVPVTGGTFTTPTTSDGSVVVSVPAGAFPATTGLTVQPAAPSVPDPLLVTTAVYEFGPDGTVFPPESPLTVTIAYDEADLGGLDESRLRLHISKKDAAGNVIGWEEADESTVDVVKNTVTGLVRHFSQGAAKAQAPVASVAIAPATVLLDASSAPASAQLTTTILDAQGTVLRNRQVSWTSSAPGVAAVDQRGNVTATGAGIAVITATSEGVSATATVTVVITPSDPAVDFSSTSNPNGRWTAGWTATLGAPLQVYPDPQDGGWFVRWLDQSINALETPNFAKNLATDGALFYGSVPGQVSLHPGCSGDQFSVLRWTAPNAGTYRVQAQFFAGDGVAGAYGETTGYVLLNGQAASPLFSTAATSTDPSYSQSIAFKAQDYVDFVVGVGDDGCYFDTTPLNVSITRVP